MFLRTKIDVAKFKDPETSLLEEQWKKYHKLNVILITVTSCIPVYGWIYLVPILIYYKQKKKAYFAAKELKENGQEDLMLKDIKYSFGVNFKEYARMEQEIYALIDLKNPEIGKILYNRLQGAAIIPTRAYPYMTQDFTYALDVLAMKLGYKHRGDLIETFERKSTSSSSTIDTGLPITKVYFIHELPPKAKCMISNLRLDIEKDTIAICPFCRNMAKKELLSEWLEENDSCPVCRRKVSIEDCPIVKIQY